MKQLSIASLLLAGGLIAASISASAEVFISEYIEGSSNNKALEIYNSGESSVSLDNYTLQIYFNGSTTAGVTISLGGNLAPQEVYVVAHSSANAEIVAQADLTSSSVNFNGDDTITLVNDSGLILDVFGQIGVDPGSYWGSNDEGTQNNTLVRKPEVLAGDPSGSDIFVPADEYFFYPSNTSIYLGSHSVGGDPEEPGDPIEGTIINPCVNCPDLPPVADPSAFDSNQFYSAVSDYVATLPSEPTQAQRDQLKVLLSNSASANQVNLSYAEVWSALTATDEDPTNEENVILIYSGRSIAKFSNGSGEASTNPDNWNREHSWPKSHGFPSQSQDAYTDIHHLRPADISVNGTRDNLDFDNSDNPIEEAPGSRVDADSFEPRDEVKGDIARMMMYMDTRYEGATGEDTPDLVLVNRLTTTGESALGKLCRLIEWHEGDPIDQTEIDRHDKIYQYQGNRNPYIDNDNWVNLVYPVENCDEEVDPGEPGEPSTPANSPLILTTIFDGTLTGGTPKGIEIFVTQDIADLSICGVGSANNGGGSDGQEFTFPADAYSAGDFIYVASESPQFVAYFGFAPTYTSGSMSINGDDAVELFCGGEVVDVYGVLDVNGDDEPWDYTDSYAKRVDNTTADGTFDLNNWEFAGRDALDGVASGTVIGLGSFQFTQRDVFISEYVEGSSFNKAIEIVNITGRDIDLSTYAIEGYQNGSASAGYTIPLEGILADQSVFVIAHPDAAPEVLAVVDQMANLQFNGDDAVVLVNAAGDVIDAIGQVGFDPGSEWGTGLVSTKDNTIRRITTVTAGDTNPDDAFDPSLEWEGFDRDTFSDLGSYPGLDGGGGGGPTVVLGQCFDEATFIHAVQGADASTPLSGQEVVVEGVVTLVSVGEGSEFLGGFFMQEEDAEHDTDPATSEGMFVEVSDTTSSLLLGDVIRVKGIAGEQFGKTQIVANEMSSICAQAVVTPAVFNLPLAEDANVEALENMLVVNTDNFIVSGVRFYARFGEVVVASERLFNPTHLYLPGSPEALALAAQNARNQFILDDLFNGSNLPTENFGELSAMNPVRAGSIVYSSQYVMDYGFSNYRLRPTNGLNYQLETRPAVPAVDGNIKVASFNVLNLFNGNGLGEEFPTSRGADTFAEYQLQQAKIVEALFEIDASAIGLMEIENDGYGAESAIAQLVDALNAKYGVDVMSYVSAGEQQGTDAISNGIIYRNDLLSVNGALQVLDSSNSIADENGPLFDTNRNRPSFAQKFTVTETDSTFVLNVNHLKSKGSSCGSGDDDTTTGQGNCNGTRTRATQALHVWLAATFSDEPILSVGDLNSYGQEDPINTLRGAGYTDLAREYNGPMAYSYTFNNEFGTLDYAMANAKALVLVQDVAEWHINADESSVFDYNEFIDPSSTPKPEQFIDGSAYRSSDHDPVIVGLLFEREALLGDVNGNGRLDIRDMIIIIRLRGVTEDSARYIAAADLNDDGIIDRTDKWMWLRLFINSKRTR